MERCYLLRVAGERLGARSDDLQAAAHQTVSVRVSAGGAGGAGGATAGLGTVQPRLLGAHRSRALHSREEKKKRRVGRKERKKDRERERKERCESHEADLSEPEQRQERRLCGDTQECTYDCCPVCSDWI